MSELQKNIESLLFIAQRPLSIKKIVEVTGASATDIEKVLETLADEYSSEKRGIILVRTHRAVEFATNPAASPLVQEYTKEEVIGDLTRAGVETLTVIAYRGPVAKEEIEQIRGVNCTIVLRNLMLRGYIEASDESAGVKRYALTSDFLRHIGLGSEKELPEYESLRTDERLSALFENSEKDEKVINA